MDTHSYQRYLHTSQSLWFMYRLGNTIRKEIEISNQPQSPPLRLPLLYCPYNNGQPSTIPIPPSPVLSLQQWPIKHHPHPSLLFPVPTMASVANTYNYGITGPQNFTKSSTPSKPHAYIHVHIWFSSQSCQKTICTNTSINTSISYATHLNLIELDNEDRITYNCMPLYTPTQDTWPGSRLLS